MPGRQGPCRSLASPASQKFRDRYRYRVSGSLRDRKDRASLPLAGAPGPGGRGGTPDPGGEGRIGYETARPTRDPKSFWEGTSERWTLGLTRGGGARPISWESDSNTLAFRLEKKNVTPRFFRVTSA